MAELEISRTNCARSEVEIRARPTSGNFVRFFLEPKSFKIPPTKCQWGPIGHLYNLGWSMGSAGWPYGGRLADPFFKLFSALAKKNLLPQGGSWALLIDAARRKGSETGLRSKKLLTRSTKF